ncbi:hypothetical protein NHX12_001976 [Muraenolepis orangiensis]|uniref:Uncharacterized protein n=1 Tax=Muraenolepis orangiensis TaxID=630683 RepID=A0A9Q0IIN3_9TELE|nr:hypothetical protein NHX12_001976 [Muraenolepis orangiensis]
MVSGWVSGRVSHDAPKSNTESQDIPPTDTPLISAPFLPIPFSLLLYSIPLSPFFLSPLPPPERHRSVRGGPSRSWPRWRQFPAQVTRYERNTEPLRAVRRDGRFWMRFSGVSRMSDALDEAAKDASDAAALLKPGERSSPLASLSINNIGGVLPIL